MSRIDELLTQRKAIDDELAALKIEAEAELAATQDKISALNAILTPPRISVTKSPPVDVEQPGDFDNGEGELDSHDIRDELRALREMSLEKRRRRA